MRAALLLLCLSVVAYQPQLTDASWGGTEGRRVLIAQEMLRGGHWLVPTLNHEPTVAKPPLHYWILAGQQALFGPGLVAMRAPSVLGLWLFALCAYRALRERFGRRAAFLGGAGALLSPVMLYHGATAEIDPLFAAATAISLLWLASAVAYGGRGRFVLAGLVGAVALMLKGPPYLLFLAGSLLVWWRHESLRPLPWFAVPLVVPPGIYYALLWFGPWVDPEVLAAVAGRESVGRVLEFEWHHVVDAPAHLLRAFAASLPLSLFTLAEFRGRHEARLQPIEIQLRMCVGAAIGAVLLLVFFPGRPVRYLLPGVLLFTCAVAPAVAAFTRVPLVPRFGQILPVRALGIAGAVALLVLPWLPFPLPGASVWFALALAAAPLFFATRTHLVAYALLVPLCAVWTVELDRQRAYEHGVRSPVDVARLLREEVERNGANDLAAFGHVQAEILLLAGLDLRGDEFRARPPTARWLLVEDNDRIAGDEQVDGYVDRSRIRARGRTIVLMERDGP